MAIANAKYEFKMIDFETNGRVSDAGVFSNTQFFKALKAKDINLPSTLKTTMSKCHMFLLPRGFSTT